MQQQHAESKPAAPSFLNAAVQREAAKTEEEHLVESMATQIKVRG